MTRIGRAKGCQQMQTTVDMLIGGFGEQGGGDCLGIDWVQAVFPDKGDEGRDDAHTGGDAVEGHDAGGTGSDISVEHRGLLAKLPSPTWLLFENSVVFAPLEFSNEIVSLRVNRDEDGVTLEPLSRVHVDGHTPTHLAIAQDTEGRSHLIVACYDDGNVCVHPLDASGHIGASAQVLRSEGHGPLPAQAGPHAHWVLPLPDGRIITTDLGADRIHVHRWSDGRLERVASLICPPGTGPRDLHLLPSSMPDDAGWRVAVVGEWSSTVDILAPDNAEPSGLRIIQRVDLGADADDQAASLAFVSDDVLHATASTGDATYCSEGFCYVGLRGSDRIISLRWDGSALSEPGPSQEGRPGHGTSSGGGRPRHIIAVGNALVVANQTSGKLSIFRLAGNGEATLDKEIVVGSPTAIVPLPRI